MLKQTKRKGRKYFFYLIVGLFSVLGFLLVLNQFVDLNPPFNSPTVLKSQNGKLALTLNTKKDKVRIGHSEVESNVYNGRYIGDTWEVKGGDRISVDLKNKTNEPTNLHLHGFHVSPKGHSDNVLVRINPGEDFQYDYKLPENHPPGLYWYHPHLHGFTDSQVGGGMLGAIIVRGNIDELPGIKGVPERVLVLTTQDVGNNTVRLVNNEVSPTMYIRPFETVRLRLVNASNDDFYNISIPGQKIHIISRDGNTLSEVGSVESELMAPGDRIEILYQAGLWGTVDVQSKEYDQGFMQYPTETFMKIKVFGLPVIPKELPTKLIPYDNFENSEIDNTRVLTFSETSGKNTVFMLDGKAFNPNEIDQVMVLGTTEEWKLVNNSKETHPFHIHINPFQVISINGEKINRKSLDDTFIVPPNSEVVIRTKYRDFEGKYVLHCHILYHEDHGMMQLVEVVKEGEAAALHNGVPDREGMGEMQSHSMDHNH